MDGQEHDGRDDGTMAANVEVFARHVVGHSIVDVEKVNVGSREEAFRITLDDCTQVTLYSTYDCCAYTFLSDFRKGPGFNNVITSVTSEKNYTKWFVMAEGIPALEMDVDWSEGNPYWYMFGFEIEVEP